MTDAIMKKVLFSLLVLMISLYGSGCYFDKENELYPQGVCDTSDVKFSTAIQPIIQANCAVAECHVNPNPQAGILLSDYAGVKLIADDGTLLKTINHDPAVSPMPKNAAKLTDCQIRKITMWVNAGAPNN